MAGALFDTNILIDYLAAVPQARLELDRYSKTAISAISWMEVLVGAAPGVEAQTRTFLQRFDLIEIDQDVAERAVPLRRSHRVKLPDAVIWASAQVHSLLLVTRNTKDFPKNDPGVRSPYVLQ